MRELEMLGIHYSVGMYLENMYVPNSKGALHSPIISFISLGHQEILNRLGPFKLKAFLLCGEGLVSAPVEFAYDFFHKAKIQNFFQSLAGGSNPSPQFYENRVAPLLLPRHSSHTETRTLIFTQLPLFFVSGRGGMRL